MIVPRPPAPLLLLLLAAGTARAQDSTLITQEPSRRYDAGGLHTFLFGSEYRDLWSTRITVPVLDLAGFAGGLEVVSRSGGQQTLGLRLRAPDGREFFFRSLDKDPSAVLPPDLRGTVASSVVRDQTSSAYPTAPLVVDRLLTAAGIPHPQPRIVVLPDDPRLGEYRAEYAGLMGTIEDRVGGPGPNGSWGGALEIIDSDSLFARVQRSTADRVDAPALLAARLFDIMIGDWDRHRDQWRWAIYDDAVPRRWRPIPLDRDQAFAKYDGLLLWLARQAAPQLTNFGPDYPGMVGASWNGRELDRRFLVGLERSTWDSVARSLRGRLTNEVIAEAVRALPPQHYNLEGVILSDWLRRRRDELPQAARDFYRLLAGQVDVHATDQADRAVLTREDNGNVSLVLSDTAGTPYLTREFQRRDTREVRVFLHGGNDTALVRGADGPVTLRVLGQGGADLLVDSAAGGSDRWYDDPAGPARTEGRSHGVDRRSWSPPRGSDPHALPPRDWGHRWRPSVWLSAGPDLGLFLGTGVSLTNYGFRKVPWSSQHRLRAGFATGPETYRVDYLGRWQRENSGMRTELFARASGIEVIRFHGFGNETTLNGPERFYRVTQDQFLLAPSVTFGLASHLSLTLGPELTFVSTDDRPGRFLATLDPYGDGDFAETGARATFELDTRNRPTAATRGVHLVAGGAVHPDWLDVRETFGEVFGVVSTYLSVKAPLDPTLALRAGGRKLWGDYPFFEAAFIGGPETVRLGRENRYAGDASAYGSAELRLFLTRMMFVVPTDFGIFGLADAGRVYLDGESSDTWHTAFGGGIWLGFLSRANTMSLSLAASDERTRLYLQAGFGF